SKSGWTFPTRLAGSEAPGPFWSNLKELCNAPAVLFVLWLRSAVVIRRFRTVQRPREQTSASILEDSCASSLPLVDCTIPAVRFPSSFAALPLAFYAFLVVAPA